MYVRILDLSVWTEFSGCELKSHSGQLFIATSKSPSVVNTIYIIHAATFM